MTPRPGRVPALLGGLSIATAAVLYGAASGLFAIGAAVALLSVAAAIPRRRIPSPAAAQVVLAIAAVAIGWIVAASATPPLAREGFQTLAAIPAGASLAALLIAAPRLLMAAPRGGAVATAAIAFSSVTASGIGHVGLLYPALVLIHMLLSVAALDSADPGRPRFRQWSRRRWAVAAVGLLAGAAACGGAAAALPPLYDQALRMSGIVPRGARTGFSTTLRLGSLTGMLVSDEPVLRIDGPAPDHLRGVVFNLYEDGHWRAPRGDRPRAFAADDPVSTGAATTLRRAGRDERRFFLPYGVRSISVPGGALVDDMGILFPARDDPADTVVVELGERRGPVVMPPTPEDLVVPDELRADLAAIAEEWTAGAHTTEARVEAMLRRFERDFQYDLIFHRPLGRDPVLTFLTSSRRGHCEYFASGMALLTRSLGVPARVVGGFRVMEHNPVGGYHVVRQQHAHAWVEVWDEDRGWITVDPTPPGALNASLTGRTPWLAGLADLFAAWTARGAQWIARRTPLELLFAGVAILLGWLAWRAVAAVRRRGRRGQRRIVGGEYEGPLPELEPLLDTLARKGAARRQTEPLETFATRLEGEGALGARGAEAAALLRRYAAWRFGGRGDEASLARDLSTWARGSGRP